MTRETGLQGMHDVVIFVHQRRQMQFSGEKFVAWVGDPFDQSSGISGELMFPLEIRDVF